MAKQLNVSLGFTADTSQAKAQLQDLQNQLSKLALTTGTGQKLGFTKEIQEATTAAAQLQVQLKNAMNVNTGTLDLGKFSEAMSKSGMSLAKYQQQLSNLGPEGDKAFAQLAQSITNAEIPLKRASSLTTELWTTLKNTARWQLSSSMLHGFMGTLQSAYGYAKDLNESLNNIRIVTGASVEEMDRFAEKANKAAKVLSTTTTAYTDAALIFYQQGLDDNQVEERTNATIKMAHAAGENATEVSSYMTAIWNNFAEGSDNLEYFGDVLANLGAQTAASSAEIATGLEKFASIGETVGLSYEYAASAVTTIVDKTRQSADTVGTALKTIFARLQGLQLGETLEDGVDLNKYSKALQAVGVSVLDLNGELRDADDIIFDLGHKWDDLSRAQQTALAQTVAGTRQYAQLMSLMNNFDDFETNVELAKSSEGVLDQQADIYAESWEAASDRVRASAEAIYSALLDDDFFIDLSNLFADVLDVVNNTIDSLGGLKGVLLTIGTIVTQVFKKQIAESLGNLAYNIKMSTDAGRQSLVDMKREANSRLVKENFDQDTTSSRAAGLAYEAQGNAQMEYINNAERMSQEEQQISQHLLDRVRLMGQLVTKSGEELEKAEEVSAEMRRQLNLKEKSNKFSQAQGDKAAAQGRKTGNVRSADTAMFKQIQNIDFGEKDAAKAQKSIQGLKETVNGLAQGYTDCGIDMKAAMGTNAQEAFTDLQNALNNCNGDLTEVEAAWNKWTQAVATSEGKFDTIFDELKNDTDLTEDQLNQLRAALLNVGSAEGNLANQSGKLAAMGEGVKKFFMGAKGEAMSMSTALTQSASAVMSFGMTVSAITGLIDTWKDSEASLTDKLLASTTTIGMLVPSVMSVIKGFQGAGQAVTIFGVQTSLAMWQVTLIVAAIAACVAIFALLIKSAQDKSMEHQMKKNQQAASDLADNLEAVKEEAQAISDAFDEYDTLVDTLNNCARGTQEWKDALDAVNDCVLDLLQQYPQLASYQNLYTRNADGMLELNKDVMETIEKDMEVLKDAASAAALLSAADVAQDRADIKSRDLKSDIGSYGAGRAYSDGNGGVYYENYVQAGQIIADNAKDLANLTKEEYAAKVTELAQQAAEGMNMTDAQFDAMVNDLIGYQDEVNELATATSNAANQMNNAALAIANQRLSDEGYDAAETKMASANMSDDYERIYDEIIELSHKNSQADSNTDYSDEIWERFEAATGKTYDQVDNTVQGNDDNRVYAYKDDSGEEQTFSEEYMAKTIAAYEAMEALTENAKTASEALGNMEDKVSSAEVSEGIKDWITTGSFASMTNSDFAGMQSDIESAGGTDAYLQDIFGMSAEELAATFGDDYVDQFNESMENYSTDMANVSKDLLTPVKTAFESLGTDNEVSLAGQKAIAGLMENAFNDGGQGGLDALKNIFANAGSDSEVLAGILNNIDWSAGDGLNQLNAALKEQGIELDTNSAEWQAYIAYMENANYSAMNTFSTLKDGLTTINSMRDAKVGDEIGLEEYEQLTALFPELKNSLIQVDEETWQLTEDMSSFLSTQEDSLNSLIMKVNSYNEMVESLTSVDEATGKSTLDTSGYNDLGEDSTASDYDAAFDALGSDAAGSAMLSSLGITQEYIQELVDAGNIEGLAELKSRIDEFLAGDYDTSGMQEQLAASAETIEELDEMVADGALTNADAYNKAWQKLHNTLDEDIDEDQYEDLAEHIQDVADANEDLSDELEDNEKAAKKVASSILRFDNAIQDVTDNYEGWMEALESGDLEGITEATEGLKDAYGDLLDIDGSSLSKDFLTNTENLKLMKEAANGSEEAYKALQEAAAADIIAHCEIENPEAFQAALDHFNNELDRINLKDIEIGAAINDEAALQSMTDLVNAAGMTAQEATDYLASMGVDAEVETVETEATDQHKYTGAKATVNTKSVEGTDPITGNPITYNIPSISYEEVPLDTESTKKETAFALKVTSANKSSGGGFKYKNSSNGGGTKGSGSGKKGGGGGGGGNKKEAKTENKKSASGEKERYHVVENQLEDLEAQYDKIAKAKDRAFGKEKLKLMDQEIAKQKEIIAKQKEYLAQAKTNLAADKKKMDKYGAKYDKNGTITNYDSLVESQVKKYNDAVEYYNSLSAEAQEKLDKEWSKKMNKDGEYYSGYIDAAGDAYDRFQESLDQYEETQDLVRDKQQEIIDAQNELYDLQLEKIDYKVNLQIDFSDDELEHLEYLLERIEEKGFAAAEAIANLGQQTQSVMNKSDAYKEGIFSILGNHGLSDSDINAWLQGDEAATQKVAGLNLTENEVEKLREYTAGLRDNNEALIEMRQAVHDKMLETFDEWNEKIDRNIDKLDHLKSMTESYRNIVDLVGKANFAGGAETIERLNASTVKQAGNYAQANIANRDRIAEQLQATRDAYAAQKDTISEEERKMWEDTIKEMEDQLNEAEEAAMGSIEEWMEAINQQFLDSVTNTMDKFADAVAGRFANLNELSEAFERQQSVNDRYLESYEKIYEFSKLNRDIEKSIDQTDNIKAKKELADLQAEINALEESGAEVSEYQMENLRKRYELKLAELALEEAQNAKSEVRMTRDNEGNWGYVYTADETQVAEAEQSYEDKLYELQQHNAEYINQLQESIITMQQEMYDKMQEIAADESLSIEERQAKMQEVQAYYQEQMGYYYSELELVLGNNKVLYEDDWQKYSDMTGYKISSDEEYVDSFDETAYSVLTGFQTMEDAQAAFNSASETMLDENLTAMDNWQTSMEDGPLKAMGSSFETLAEDIDKELGNIETESDNTTQEIEDDCDDSVDAYNGVIEAVIAWENQYSQSVDAMMDYSDNLIDKFNQVLALWADVKAAAEEAEDPPTPDDGGDDGGGGNNGGGGGGGDGKPSWDRVVAAYNKINGGKWGNGLQNRINKGKSDGFTEAEVRAGQQLINYTYPPNLNGYGYSREKAKSLMGYDTGGYTGEWGDTSGRLALLHQKELVLNQEDTANMLSAIEMIRQISSLIDLNAMSSMKGLGGMLAAGGVGQTMSGIEQHIEIHASFPDATDHSEIEEAFHNLLNSASQYANRKL